MLEASPALLLPVPAASAGTRCPCPGHGPVPPSAAPWAPSPWGWGLPSLGQDPGHAGMGSAGQLGWLQGARSHDGARHPHPSTGSCSHGGGCPCQERDGGTAGLNGDGNGSWGAAGGLGTELEEGERAAGLGTGAQGSVGSGSKARAQGVGDRGSRLRVGPRTCCSRPALGAWLRAVGVASSRGGVACAQAAGSPRGRVLAAGAPPAPPAWAWRPRGRGP